MTIKPNSEVMSMGNQMPELRSDSSLLEVDSARAVAQIQGAMTIAKKFPRDEIQAMNRITAAAKRRKVAEQSEYEYNKGGTSVSGASIRAAETISQAWGNMISGITEVNRDGDKKESLMLAYAADLETNNWKFMEWRVPHAIDKTGGPKALTSGRDIYEKIMNDGSRRLRNCLLAVIPGDVTDTFLEECNKTLSVSEVPLVTRLSQMCDAMKTVGVTQPMIENKMGCAFGAITERQLAQLRRIYQAIKDGFGKVSDYFKEAEGAERTDAFKKALTAEPAQPAPVKPIVQQKKEAAPTFEAEPESGTFADFRAPTPGVRPGIIEEDPVQEELVPEPQDLVMQVIDAAEKAGMDIAKLTKRCEKDFKKTPREMETKELVKLLTALKKEAKK